MAPREASHPDLTWLRIGYWVAAIADFIIAITAWFPSLAGVEGYVYPMGLFSAVAFSWGVLLILADRKPLERRWVMVPTMLVVALLGLAALHAYLIGVMPLLRIVPAVSASIVIFSVLWYGFRRSRPDPASTR